MEVSVDIKEVKKFVEDGSFVRFMNDKGLSFGAMAFILQTLTEKIAEIKD